MEAIRIQKIDGVEFVTYKDYLRLKEIAHEELKELKEAAETVKELEEENKNLKEEVDFWGTQANKHQKELFEKHDRIINQMKKIEELKEENKKLKERIEQIKETYIRFEDSEKDYNKWLGELDKLIMNR